MEIVKSLEGFTMNRALTLLVGLALVSVACRHKPELQEPVQADKTKSNSTLSDTPSPWEDAGEGIQYQLLQKTDPVNNVHVTKIDLNNPNVALFSTRSEDKKTVVSKFASTYRCRVAVNSDLFNGTFVPLGLAAGGGKAWADTKDNNRSGFVAIGLDNKVTMSHGEEIKTHEPWMYSIVSGFPMMVRDGKLGDLTCKCAESFYNARHPRTAFGLSQDGKTGFLVVVDGRSETSKGMTIKELADLMLSLGAHQAINFDGGGSSAMFVAKKGGIVNKPTDGKERVVANHIGVCDGKADDLAALQKIRPTFKPQPAELKMWSNDARARPTPVKAGINLKDPAAP